jgi:anti-anti-sigma factor
MGQAASVRFGVEGGALVARVAGDLGGAESLGVFEEIALRLRDHGGGLVLDLTGVTDMGSAAVGKLLRLGQVCREAGRKLAVASPASRAMRVLRLVGATAAVGHYGSVREALAALGT